MPWCSATSTEVTWQGCLRTFQPCPYHLLIFSGATRLVECVAHVKLMTIITVTTNINTQNRQKKIQHTTPAKRTKNNILKFRRRNLLSLCFFRSLLRALCRTCAANLALTSWSCFAYKTKVVNNINNTGMTWCSATSTSNMAGVSQNIPAMSLPLRNVPATSLPLAYLRGP